MTPFSDIPVDSFTLVPSFTFPASMTVQRRWLQNDRVNALRQTTMFNFRARVVRPNVALFGGSTPLSYMGQVRCTPGCWLFAVSANTGPSTRLWDSSGASWTQGIPIAGPLPFSTFRNNSLSPYILMDEPWFLPDGIVNWEQHNQSNATFALFVAEPRAEIKGEILAACADQRMVTF
jgi:hypothetical protein